MAPSRNSGRRGVCTAVATACAATGITLLAVAAFAPPAQPSATTPATVRTPQTPAPSTADSGLPVLGPSQPVHVSAPAVGLDASVDTVGTADDGTIALPGQGSHAGWYSGSVTPGQRGNALLVGHLDTTRGPAAFYPLGALRTGDRITVHRRDETVAHFTVTALNTYDKDEFPSTSVYAPTTQPLLTLITCADWDTTTRAYTANLVVTARPANGTQL